MKRGDPFSPHSSSGGGAMSITQIGGSSSLLHLNFATKTLDSPKHNMRTSRRINVPKENPAEGVESSQNGGAVDDFQALNAARSSVATGTKFVDSTMGRVETIIDRMKEQLGRIIKNYPPFPPGSEARVKFLRSFKALRREIDELSFSSNNNDDAAPKITADSAAVSRANERNAATGGKESNRTIPNHQVSTELTGLKIPDLSENATDEEINAAIKNLDDVKKTLNQRQSGFAANASRGDQFVESEPRMDKLSETHAEGIKSYDMTEIVAQNKSSDDKLILTMKSITSLTKDQSQLMELLR